MQIEYSGFSIIPDNEIAYFNLLESVISAVDCYCYLSITKTPSSCLFRISPSEASLINILIEELNKMHNLMKIDVLFSKSMKSASSVTFKLNLIEE